MKRLRHRLAKRNLIRRRCKILWEDGRCDGPLTGVCLYRENPVYFSLLNWHDKIWIYALHKITKRQYFQLLNAHEMFRKYVGSHSDHFYTGIQWPNNESLDVGEYNSWRRKNPAPDCTKTPVIGYISEKYLITIYSQL
jgi:hypothetical protein